MNSLFAAKNTMNNAAVLEERTRYVLVLLVLQSHQCMTIMILCRSDGGFEMSVKNVGPLPHVHFLRHRPFAAIIPGDGVAEQVITTGLNQFLSLYNAALIGRLVLTWFPNPPQVIVTPLATICDPYLNLFRGIIPPLGGTIDLSPILAFVVLDVRVPVDVCDCYLVMMPLWSCLCSCLPILPQHCQQSWTW